MNIEDDNYCECPEEDNHDIRSIFQLFMLFNIYSERGIREERLISINYNLFIVLINFIRDDHHSSHLIFLV